MDLHTKIIGAKKYRRENSCHYKSLVENHHQKEHHKEKSSVLNIIVWQLSVKRAFPKTFSCWKSSSAKRSSGGRGGISAHDFLLSPANNIKTESLQLSADLLIILPCLSQLIVSFVFLLTELLCVPHARDVEKSAQEVQPWNLKCACFGRFVLSVRVRIRTTCG